MPNSNGGAGSLRSRHLKKLRGFKLELYTQYSFTSAMPFVYEMHLFAFQFLKLNDRKSIVRALFACFIAAGFRCSFSVFFFCCTLGKTVLLG